MKVFHPTLPLNIERFKRINFFELIFRVVIGLFLILDGMHILSHVVQLEAIFIQTMNIKMADFIITFIGVAHLLGGTFIILGFFTRVVIIIQIPAILAEMYYIQPPNSLLGSWEIWASAILLILMVFLFVNNSGSFSLDYFRKRKQTDLPVEEQL
jgi:uncharacterized membrane protein YphA (DoxX/SURF4 family)